MQTARVPSTRRRRSVQGWPGASRRPAMRPEPRTDLLARRNPPIARGRGAATRNQLPAAGVGQPPRPAAELRDTDRQSVGLQRQQRGRDELDTARPWLGAPPGDRDATNRLGVVGVLGVAQRHQDRSLLDRHPVRDCNGRSRRRPQSDLSARLPLTQPPHFCSDARQPALTGPPDSAARNRLCAQHRGEGRSVRRSKRRAQLAAASS